MKKCYSKERTYDSIPEFNDYPVIQGTFWCKGIGSATYEGVFSFIWAKALFVMSTFVLVPGGDSNIPTIQQQLNKAYNDYFGILISCTVTRSNRVTEPDYGVKTVYEFKPTDGTKISTKWTVEVYLRHNRISEMQPDDMEAFENLLKLTGYVTNSNEAADLVRMFEIFLSMTVQPPSVTCLTIEVGGMIASFALEMLLVLVL